MQSKNNPRLIDSLIDLLLISLPSYNGITSPQVNEPNLIRSIKLELKTLYLITKLDIKIYKHREVKSYTRIKTQSLRYIVDALIAYIANIRKNKTWKTVDRVAIYSTQGFKSYITKIHEEVSSLDEVLQHITYHKDDIKFILDFFTSENWQAEFFESAIVLTEVEDKTGLKVINLYIEVVMNNVRVNIIITQIKEILH